MARKKKEIVTKEEVVISEPVIEAANEELPKEETPVVEQQIVPEPQVAELVPSKEEIVTEETELTMGDKILLYVQNTNSEVILLNDFLKTLFSTAKYNEPKPYLSQSASKLIKMTINELCSKGLIKVVNNTHQRLNNAYYPDNTGVTHYHDLNTLQIHVKK